MQFENVSIAEVEIAPKKHKYLADGAVVPVPDARFGEGVYAFATALPRFRITPESLRRSAEEILARFKVPKPFQIVDKFPKTGSGKIDGESLKASPHAEIVSGTGT